MKGTIDMAGNRWNSMSGDDGGIKTDKDLDGDFKKAAEGEEEPTPITPNKEDTDQPTKENNPPGPKNPWDRKAQQQSSKSHDIKKGGPSPK